MAKRVGTSDLLEVLGSDREANGAPALTTPSLSTIERGFYYDPTIPSSAVINSNNVTWASNVLGEKINHVLQNGVPQWVSTTTYAIGNVVNRTNSLWIALASNTNSAPTVFNANWTQVQSGFDPLTRDIIQGSAPEWLTNTTISMKALNCLDSLRTSLITCSSSTLNFATTGLNGLDTGSIASNTWYYIYAILNPTTLATGYLASTSASSPTLPSGFTKFRLLPFVVKTNSGSATLQSFTMYHSDGLLRCEWLASRVDEVLITQSMGSATPYVVDASSSVPPICNGLNAKLFARIYQDTGGSGSWSRLSIDPSTAGNWVSFATSPWVAERLADIPLYPTTRQFRIRNDASGGGAAACTGIVYSQGYVFNYKGTV